MLATSPGLAGGHCTDVVRIRSFALGRIDTEKKHTENMAADHGV